MDGENTKVTKGPHQGHYVPPPDRTERLIVVIVELKAVAALATIHDQQVLSYMRATGLRAGLLVNFEVRRSRRILVPFVFLFLYPLPLRFHLFQRRVLEIPAGLHERLFEPIEPACELVVRSAERRFWFDVQLS